MATTRKSTFSPVVTALILWLKWMGVSLIGEYVFLAISGVAMFFAIRPFAIMRIASLTIGWAAAGTIIGLTQWLVLKKYIGSMKQWMVATSIGWALGGALIGIFSTSRTLFMDVLSNGVILGAAVGIAQRLVLREYFRGTDWWILACVIGAAIGSVIGFLLVGAQVIGIAFVTAPILIWFSQQPNQ